MNKPTNTENEIATYARRTARAARKLRTAGQNDAADQMVREAAARVEWYRAHRADGGRI